MDMFNGMFGKVASGMCRLSMNGEIAVKTSTGYKTYNTKTKKFVNCSNFVFNVGEEFFFVVPTNKVKPGDIIIVSGKPRCVISVDTDSIKVVNYEDSTIENILPERQVFMGNSYFYGKIVSMFGNDFKKGKKGMNKILSYMMISEMMKNGSSQGNSGIGNMLPLMLMMNNNGGGFLENIFDLGDIEDDEEDEEE